MQFEPLTHKDLKHISPLQPQGWSDIVAIFEFYINSHFCYAVKASINNTIVGVGAAILFGETGWMAHVIVAENYRKKGIGYSMVCELLNHLENRSVATCSLIATPLGAPVYEKAGFRNVTPYTFLQRKKPWPAFPVSQKAAPFKTAYREEIMTLDREVSGENREPLLADHLSNALVYLERQKVKGYYIPGLGEGPIIADSTAAGLELMKLKYAKAGNAALPSDNLEGIAFLKQNGFAVSDKKGIRMIRGEDIGWKPEKIYSRIGGNFG